MSGMGGYSILQGGMWLLRTRAAWSVAAGLFVAATPCGPLGTASVLAQDWPPSLNLFLNPDARLITWETRDGSTGQVRSKGTQFYVPFGAEGSARFGQSFRVSLVARSGYVQTRNKFLTNNPSDVDDRNFYRTESFESITDTSLNAKVSLFSIPGIQPYVSMAVNLPTGRTLVRNRSVFVDTDIVQLGAYGQGLNLAPTVGVNVPIGSNFLASIAGGWARRGTLDRFIESPRGQVIAVTDPGDSRTLSGTLAYQNGPFSARVLGSYTFHGATTVNHFRTFKNGESYSMGASVDYELNRNWSVSTSFTRSHSKINFLPIERQGPLFPEDFNSNNAVNSFTADPTYAEGRWSFGPLFAYTYRDRNGWDPAVGDFVPAKQSRTFGVTAQFAATDTLKFTSRVERTSITEDPGRQPQPTFESEVWLYTFGGSIKF